MAAPVGREPRTAPNHTPSVLDLAPIPSGSTATEALHRTIELARLADRLGYVRYWFAEHHNLPGIGSSAPEVLIAYAAARTERILGSTGASARFAGASGLGYAFASHFSPTPAAPALRVYRESFTPSEAFPAPHAILGVAAVCAGTGERADDLASSLDLSWANLLSGRLAPPQPGGGAGPHLHTAGTGGRPRAPRAPCRGQPGEGPRPDRADGRRDGGR